MAAVGAQYRGASGSSRLGAMQARIREQLMLEKESRLLEMAARQEAEREDTIHRVTRTSANSNLSSSLSSLSSFNSSMGGQGKVRQMFQNRRSNGYGHSPVGRDKSYPLEPMRANGRPPAKPPVKGVVRNRGVSVDRGRAAYDPEAMRRSRSHAAFQNQQNGLNNNNSPYEQRAAPAGRGLRAPQGRGGLPHHKSTSSLLDANQNYNGRGSSSSSGVYSRGPSRDPSPAPSPSHSNANRFGFRTSASRGPSPAPHSQSASPVHAPRPAPIPRRTQSFPSRPDPPDGPRPPPRQQRGPAPPPRRQRQTQPSPPPPEDRYTPPPQSKSTTRTPVTQVKPARAAAKPVLAPKPKGTQATTPRPSKPVPGLASCKICGRNFAPDRIEKHETICQKTLQKNKKRKVFDPVKMRTKGTEAEKFVARGKHLQPAPKSKKKDWKKQHEDFIATIRAAKQGTAPPPVDTSDYVNCPHCGRNFSEAAADRHIPKCASILSNKPAPGRRR